MDYTSPVDVKKAVRGYIVVFVSLMALTLITVGISYFHLETKTEIAVAMLIALVKGSLVASYFMHLISEKKIIFLTLTFTVLFLLGMMILMMIGQSSVMTVPK